MRPPAPAASLALVGALLLPGCLDVELPGLPGKGAPGAARTYDFAVGEHLVRMSDGVLLAASVYTPTGAPGDRFPGVLFIHGWGADRHVGAYPTMNPTGRNPILGEYERFAAAGYVVLAYDVRGFGESGGTTTLLGERERRDVVELLDWMEGAQPVTGAFGVTGGSYGGGHAWTAAFLGDERVRAVAPHFGWVDLVDGIVPNGVPKHWWIVFLGALGIEGSGGRYDPRLFEWFAAWVAREGTEEADRELRARGVVENLSSLRVPVLINEGLHETIFPQGIRAFALARSSGAPLRLHLYEGGHGSYDPASWNLTLKWFNRFLKGVENDAASGPAIDVFEEWTGSQAAFDTYPPPALRTTTLYLHGAPVPALDGALDRRVPTGPEPSMRYAWSGVSGASDEIVGLSEVYGLRGQRLPRESRGVPGEQVANYASAPLGAPIVLFGSPRVNLTLVSPLGDAQVVARLYDLAPDGTTRDVARGWFDASRKAEPGAPVTVEFDLVRHHYRFDRGHRFLLQLSAEDVTYTMPFPRPFSAEILHGSAWPRIDLPLLGEPAFAP